LEKTKAFDPTRANINIPDSPLIISNKNWVSRNYLLKRYIFNKNYFIKHLNRDQFNSLYKLAKKLDDANELAEIIAYDKEEKKRKPIILRAGGKGYPKAYLEGRVQNDKYSLILHLSNREFILEPKKLIELEEIKVEIEEKLSEKLIATLKLIEQISITKEKLKEPILESDWISEKIELKDVIRFYKNKKHKGWVSINKIEEGSPAWKLHKAHYQVEINTPYTLETKYFKELQYAFDFAEKIMIIDREKYSEGLFSKLKKLIKIVEEIPIK